MNVRTSVVSLAVLAALNFNVVGSASAKERSKAQAVSYSIAAGDVTCSKGAEISTVSNPVSKIKNCRWKNGTYKNMTGIVQLAFQNNGGGWALIMEQVVYTQGNETVINTNGNETRYATGR